MERAGAVLPGGNTRSVLHFDPFPLAFERGEGAHLWSLDGDRYTDFLGEFTAGLYGHSHPVILDAIRALARAWHQLRRPQRARAPAGGAAVRALPRVRARALHELRDRGQPDGARARAAPHGPPRGARLQGRLSRRRARVRSGEPSPVTVPHAFVVGDYDDVEETRALIREHELGAILVEPMLGSGGCIPASDAFLRMLREEATAAGAVLIFDEVMTSRLPRPVVVPDLMTRRQVPGRRHVLRRVRRAARADGGLRPDASRRAGARGHVQQQRRLDERGHRRAHARC